MCASLIIVWPWEGSCEKMVLWMMMLIFLQNWENDKAKPLVKITWPADIWIELCTVCCLLLLGNTAGQEGHTCLVGNVINSVISVTFSQGSWMLHNLDTFQRDFNFHAYCLSSVAWVNQLKVICDLSSFNLLGHSGMALKKNVLVMKRWYDQREDKFCKSFFI